MGHPPFGHAGEEQLDACLRERFGTGFRHNEQSLRIAEQLNLTAEVRDGILTHTGRARARDARGQDRPASSTASPTSTTTSTTRSAAGCSRRDDLPRDEIELLGATGSSADRHARARPRSRAPSAPATSCQSEEVGAAMLALRAVHVRARLPRAEHARSEHVRAHDDRRRIFDHLVERGDSPDEIRRVRLRHDRPLRAVSTPSGSDGPDQGDIRRERSSPRPTWWRSSPAVRRCERPAPRYSGRCPFHEERTPSVLRQSGRQARTTASAAARAAT